MTELTCAEFVELVTAYLDGALDPASRVRFEQHAAACEGCARYLEQIRTTISEVGRLEPDALDPEMRDTLLTAFRSWAERPEGDSHA